jgi:hypothetical protein
MKSWLIFLIPLLVIVLVPILVLFQRTRLAMAKFAKRHAMTYEKTWWNLFGIGEIHGEVGHEAFFMGLMSSNYGFGPVAEQDYPEEKYPQMHIEIEGMPRKLVIQKRVPGRIGNIVEVLSRKTGMPMLETGDEAFDSQFKVIGYKDEVLPWLTARRREAIAAFLSRENYDVSKGGLKYGTIKTHIRLDEMEEAFAHLTAAQRELQKVQ